MEEALQEVAEENPPRATGGPGMASRGRGQNRRKTEAAAWDLVVVPHPSSGFSRSPPPGLHGPLLRVSSPVMEGTELSEVERLLAIVCREVSARGVYWALEQILCPAEPEACSRSRLKEKVPGGEPRAPQRSGSAVWRPEDAAYDAAEEPDNTSESRDLVLSRKPAVKASRPRCRAPEQAPVPGSDLTLDVGGTTTMGAEGGAARGSVPPGEGVRDLPPTLQVLRDKSPHCLPRAPSTSPHSESGAKGRASVWPPHTWDGRATAPPRTGSNPSADLIRKRIKAIQQTREKAAAEKRGAAAASTPPAKKKRLPPPLNLKKTQYGCSYCQRYAAAHPDGLWTNESTDRNVSGPQRDSRSASNSRTDSKSRARQKSKRPAKPSDDVLQVWVVGNSYIYFARKFADATPEGKQLGFPQDHLEVRWLGFKKLMWHQVFNKLEGFVDQFGPPSILVLHVGQNDSRFSKKNLIQLMKNEMMELIQLMPYTVMVWSEMIHRRFCLGAIDNPKAKKTRIRINRTMSTFVTKSGGVSLRHTNLESDEKDCVFKPDGINLNEKGLELFIKTLKTGISEALVKKGEVVP